MKPIYFFLANFFIFSSEIDASHFRGGIITWRPVNPYPSSNITQIEISYRMSWRRSFGSQHYCTEEDIAEGNMLTGEGSLQCSCSGLNQQLSYVCTDFSEAEDWTSGVSSALYQPNIPTFDIWFSNCCWISTLLNGADAQWTLTTSVDLTVRSDTGLINSSPTTTILPIVRYHRECQKSITIPVADPDGDDVRCFFAINCGTGCFTLPGAVLDSTGCELTWDAANASTGLYGVSLEIMDFANTTSNKALSFIPLQFLLDVYSSPTSCGEKPVIIPPTRPHDSCLGIPQSSTYHEVIVARASSTNVSIIEIATISPPGMIKSDLAPYPYGLSTDYYINTTWTPTTTGEEEIMCFTAEDIDGSVSPQTCITLVTGNSPPEIIAMTPSRGGRVPLQDLHMQLIYDQTVARPSRSTMISLYSQNGNMVYQVDSENRYQVNFPGDNTLRFTIPAQYLREMTSYYILMGSGVARSTTYCGIESSATTYTNEWSFFVTEVPEATTYFPVTSDLTDVTSDAPDVTTDTPGDDDRYADEIVLLCGPTSFQIDIPRQLVEASFPATGLYLMGDAVNPNCRSFANYPYISLNSSLTECGTEYTDNATHSFYTNSVVNHDDNTNMIVEYLSLQIPISCDYDRSKKLLSHFVTISDYIMKREKGEFVYDFAIYTDISYTVKYNKYPVETQLGTNLFFRSELLRAADNLEIHLRSCRATPSPNYEDSLVYEFIKDGCGANSAAVRVLKPHKQTQADFELTSFRFRQDLGSEFSQVWIHCEVIVCDVNDAYSECHRGCEENRYRRSIKESDQQVKRVTRGPILLNGNDGNAEKSLLSVKTLVNNEEGDSANDIPSVFTTALSVIFIIMVMTLMTMGVALHRVMRRLNYKGYEALSNGTD